MRISLSLKINVIIVAVVSFVTLSFAVYDYTNDSKKRLVRLSKDIAAVNTRLQKSLVSPLWDLNPEDVDSLVRSEMINSNILAINVIEKFSNRIIVELGRNKSLEVVSKKVDGTSLNAFDSKRTEIVKSGRILGHFNIYFTDSYVRTETELYFKEFLVKMALLLLIEVVFLVIIIQRNILRPISLLEASFSDTEGKNISGKLDTERNDELGQLARSFLAMRDHIATLFTERDNKIVELESAKKDLIKWGHIFENAKWGIALGSIDGQRFDLMNPAYAKLHGYTVDELLGKEIPDIFVPSVKKKLPGIIKKCHDIGHYTFEGDHVRKDGSTFPVYHDITTVKDEKGEVLYRIVGVVDISDWKEVEKEKEKLESRLSQAQKMEAIGTLAGGIAHDFNNILSAIIGYTEIAKLKLPQDSKIASDLNQVFKAGNRAKELVKQILAFSRQSEQELKPLEIHTIVKEALTLLRSSIPTTIEIRHDIDPQSGTVLSDATQIHQITMNLCTNAYHAMRETGGVLGITMCAIQVEDDNHKVESFNLSPGSYVELAVSDTGVGMDKNTIDKIFDPYFTTRKKGEGTGLGLSVVHGIIKSYGGDISVYSEPGEGTTFRLYLPRITPDTTSAEAETDGIYPTGNERALIVDDEEIIVEMLKQMLTSLGYHVTALSSSSMALQTFKNDPNSFDFIVTDMTMPIMNGAELIQRIRGIRPDIPIIMCTGFSDLIDKEKALALGISKYLMKPVLTRDLAKAVREILG